jgi:hypothetical protein
MIGGCNIMCMYTTGCRVRLLLYPPLLCPPSSKQTNSYDSVPKECFSFQAPISLAFSVRGCVFRGSVLVMLSATQSVKCVSVLVVTWTSYALYHVIWMELFYGQTVDLGLYTDMLTAEIVLVGVILASVVLQYYNGKHYDPKPYLGLFSTSAAAIVGITALLVLLHHPGTAYPALDGPYTADLDVPIMDLHTRLSRTDANALADLLFPPHGLVPPIGTGADMLDSLPHGPLMYIFLSALFTVAYIAPLVLLGCGRRLRGQGQDPDSATGHNNNNRSICTGMGVGASSHNGVDRDLDQGDGDHAPCFQWLPVWPSLALVQIVIACLAMYSWMFPSLDVTEVVMVLAITCGISCALIAGYTIYARTRRGGCACRHGINASYNGIEQYYTDPTLHVLVAVAVVNFFQAMTSITAYTREVQSSSSTILYTTCIEVLDLDVDVDTDRSAQCTALVSLIMALTFRVMLVFYLVAILVLRTIELTQVCSTRSNDVGDEGEQTGARATPPPPAYDPWQDKRQPPQTSGGTSGQHPDWKIGASVTATFQQWDPATDG